MGEGLALQEISNEEERPFLPYASPIFSQVQGPTSTGQSAATAEIAGGEACDGQVSHALVLA